ncbi:hypothetical protein [Halomonas daqiaonensis]|uniref:Phasin protein n=1 Tax=Halomonas daqiaonensis TaxID=650850 RepID=A0A1H7QGL6_9GAMM|nr:hypothetical protein [Halomonas daqiaonensis]SEL47073.1 hypothetical protein SAMN04488129_110112 [Halomonas daqiaonensis]
MSIAEQVSMGPSFPEVVPEVAAAEASAVTLEVIPEVTSEEAPEVTLEVVPGVTVDVVSEVATAASHSAVSALPTSVAQASQQVFDWWLHHWMDASHPLARLQCAWMESVFEVIQVEAEFLNACALSNAKVWSCLTDARSLADSASLHSCYHEVAKDMADAHLARLSKVAELPDDFQQRLWEEIC